MLAPSEFVASSSSPLPGCHNERQADGAETANQPGNARAREQHSGGLGARPAEEEQKRAHEGTFESGRGHHDHGFGELATHGE